MIEESFSELDELIDDEELFERDMDNLLSKVRRFLFIDSEPKLDLAGCLQLRTLKYLKSLAKLYELKGFSYLKKAELISELVHLMLSPEGMFLVLTALERKEWALFLQLQTSDMIVAEEELENGPLLLLSTGFLVIYRWKGYLHYVIPREIKEAYKDLANSKFVRWKERILLLTQYAEAAVNLYGFLSIPELIKIFNRQNKVKTSEEECYEVLSSRIGVTFDLDLENEYLVHFMLEKEYKSGALDEFIFESDIDLYIPSKRQFLLYSDEKYTEQTSQLQNLEKFLTHELLLPAVKAKEMTGEIAVYLKDEYSIQMYVDILEKNDIFLEGKLLQHYLEDITAAEEHTRKWINRGYSNYELSKDRKKNSSKIQSIVELTDMWQRPEKLFDDELVNDNIPLVREKIGRNAPCPCGSGKKYKKCCGRNNNELPES